MALHAPSWPLVGQDSMTAASNDLGIIESSNEQRQLSNSNDHEWARFLASLNHHDQDSSPSNGIDLGSLDLNDNIPTHFGSMDNLMHTDPLPPCAATSSAPSILDPNGATQQQYTTWPEMEFTAYDQASTPWMPPLHQQQQQQQQQYPLKYESNSHFMSDGDGLGIQMAPTSHPIYPHGALHYDQPFMSQESPLDYNQDYRQDTGAVWDRQEHSMPPQDDLFADDDEAEPEDSADPCYAQLLHRCLKEAPGHTMSLRELYEWVSQHSQKAKDLKNRGWQNSVRHNLSMNAAFQRVPHSAGPKKGSLWRLTDDALKMGVISTTRYRKDPKRKSDRRSTTPAPNRQASGARGGRATRDATRMRQRNANSPTINRFRRSERRQNASRFSPYSCSPSPGMPPTSPHTPSPYFLDLDSDEAANNYPLPLSVGQTPPPLSAMMMYNNEQQPKLPLLHHQQQNLDYLPLEYGGQPAAGFFGGEMMLPHHHHHHHTHNYQDQQQHQQQQQQQQQTVTPTPSQASYMTDTSFMTDENVPALMMSTGSHHNNLSDDHHETTTTTMQ